MTDSAFDVQDQVALPYKALDHGRHFSVFFLVQSATFGIGLALLQRQAQWIYLSSSSERVDLGSDRVHGRAHLLLLLSGAACASRNMLGLEEAVVAMVSFVIQHDCINMLGPCIGQSFLCLFDIGLGEASLAVQVLADREDPTKVVNKSTMALRPVYRLDSFYYVHFDKHSFASWQFWPLSFW